MCEKRTFWGRCKGYKLMVDFLNLYLLNLYVSISIGCGVLHSPVDSIIKVVLRNLF